MQYGVGGNRNVFSPTPLFISKLSVRAVIKLKAC